MTQTQELQAMLDKNGIVTIPSGEYIALTGRNIVSYLNR